MGETDGQPLQARLDAWVGRRLGNDASVAPDPVNVPMIRHWVDALDDRNPIYLDSDPVAPPAMLQTWTMARPVIQGLAERGGAPTEIAGDSPIRLLDDAGFTGTRATNSELEFVRYLRPGDRVRATTVIDSISTEKSTALGAGHFVTWVTTYTDEGGDVVGRQLFRVLKFRPVAP